MSEREFKTADFAAAAYLFARRFRYDHVEVDGEQVSFIFPSTPELVAAVGEYLSNGPIPCRDYFQGLRKAKAIIQTTIQRGDYDNRKR